MSDFSLRISFKAAEPQAERIRLIGGMLAFLALICLTAAAGLMLLKPQRSASLGMMLPASQATLEEGGALYGKHCASCHGTLGNDVRGRSSDARRAPSLDETGHAFNHSDLELYARIANGARGADGLISMPAFRSVLPDSEILAVMSYIAAGWPDEVLRRRRAPDWTFPADCGPLNRANTPAVDLQ